MPATPRTNPGIDPVGAALHRLLTQHATGTSVAALRRSAADYARAAWMRGIPRKIVTTELRQAFDAETPDATSLHKAQRERLVTLVVAAYSAGDGKTTRPR